MSNILRRLGQENSSIPNYSNREEVRTMVIPEKMQTSASTSDVKETVISPDAEFKGSLKFKDSLRIDGNFDGEIESDGTLFVGKTGNVKAEIQIGNIVVEGKIEGNVLCQDKIELRSTAKMFGDIEAKRLTIAEGVNIVGKCSVSSTQVAEPSKPEKPYRAEQKRAREEKAREEKERSEEKVGSAF